MLNPFPHLLDAAFFAPTLLRLGAACVFAYLCVYHWRNRSDAARELSILSPGVATLALNIYVLIEGLVALGLLVGLYTQVVALVGGIIALKVLVVRRGLHHVAPLSRSTYTLIFVICLSLVLTGAGAFAFDVRL